MTHHDYAHPLERRNLFWRTWPYLAVMALSWLLLPWVGVIGDRELVLAAAVLNVVLVLAVIALPWERLGAAASAVPPLAWLGVVALLRHGTDGATAGYAPLVLLTLLWSAVYASRWMLVVSTVAVFTMLAAPTILGSSEMYPDTEVRRALLLCATGLLVGVATQQALAALRAERVRRRDAEAELTRRRAFELNDDVVQDLAVAKLAFEAGHTQEAHAAVERALDAGKRIISDMVEATGRFEREATPERDA